MQIDDLDAEIDSLRQQVNKKFGELAAVVAALNDLLVPGQEQEEPR